MSKRAEMRRNKRKEKKSIQARNAERREVAKIEKMQGPVGDILRAANNGRADGRMIAFCIVSDNLYEVWGWRKGRINPFLDKCNHEATRWDHAGVHFVLEYYAQKIVDKMDETGVQEINNDIESDVYSAKRDEYFISSLALMFSVLNADYHMSSNSRNSGRLDKLLDKCIEEYVKVQLEPKNHKTIDYAIKIMKKTGIQLVTTHLAPLVM
jgi:hypothetical protein